MSTDVDAFILSFGEEFLDCGEVMQLFSSGYPKETELG